MGVVSDMEEPPPPTDADRRGANGHGHVNNAAKRPSITWHDGQKLAEPLPPRDWKCEGLRITPGRPHEFVGFGFSGKTIFVQEAGLSIASGTPVWGRFECKQGAVKHFDYEMGFYDSVERYQRLAYAKGIDLAELGDGLQLANYPDVYLDTPQALDVYARECEGVDLAIIDALRGATPGTDENSSAVRVCLDNLARISEKQGTAFVVLLHSGKTQDRHSDARQKGRGSSAIFDAAGTQIVFEAKGPGQPIRVEMTKAAGGPVTEPFYLSIVDVLGDDLNARAGLAVRYQDADDRDEEAEVDATAKKNERDARRILAALRKEPGQSTESIRLAVNIGKSRLPLLLSKLCEQGRLRRTDGEHGAHLYFPQEPQ